MFLVYGGKEGLSIKGYIDTIFQTERDDSRSQSGFIFLINGEEMCWRSSKQETLADSKTESEYTTINEAVKEAIWLGMFISDLDVVPSMLELGEIFYANKGVVSFSKQGISHKDLRHILKMYGYMKKLMEDGDIIVS